MGKLKRDILTQNDARGGRRMLYLCKLYFTLFYLLIGLSENLWIKKIYYMRQLGTWISQILRFPRLCFSFSRFGSAITPAKHEVDDLFWRDVFECLLMLNNNLEDKIWEDLKIQPLMF